MAQWVKLCGMGEAPEPGEVAEVEANGVALCLANVEGRLAALDNLCPHLGGPLGQGWIEGGAVICPWHAWAFDPVTGQAAQPECAQVRVYPLRVEGEAVEVDVEQG